MDKRYKKLMIIVMAVLLLAYPAAAGATSSGSSQSGGGSTGSTGGTTGDAATESAQPSLSKDNSLKSLSLSEGELSPAFEGSTLNYTATVGADVTSVEVDAQLSNRNAVIDGISGNTDLQFGENKITVTVTSPAGTKAVYTITVTREEESDAPAGGEGQDGEAAAGEEPDGETADGDGADGSALAVVNADGTVTLNGKTYEVSENYLTGYGVDGQVYSENTYETLEERYQTLKKRAVILFAVLVVVICILCFALFNMKLKHRLDGEEEIDMDEMFTRRPSKAHGQDETGEDADEDAEDDDFLTEEGDGFWKDRKKKVKTAESVSDPADSPKMPSGSAKKPSGSAKKPSGSVQKPSDAVQAPTGLGPEEAGPVTGPAKSADVEVEIMDLNDL